MPLEVGLTFAAAWRWGLVPHMTPLSPCSAPASLIPQPWVAGERLFGEVGLTPHLVVGEAGSFHPRKETQWRWLRPARMANTSSWHVSQSALGLAKWSSDQEAWRLAVVLGTVMSRSAVVLLW